MAEKKKPKGLGLLKFALFLLIVLVIAGVAIYSFLRINPADVLSDGVAGLYNRIFTEGAAELNEAVRTIAAYDLNEKVSLATISDNLIIVSISAVRQVDPEGREKAYIPVNLKKPYVQAYKEDVLVADLQGRYFSLISQGRIVWEKNIDEDIVNAAISDAWVLIITRSKESGYKRTIRAYSRDGQEISFRNISNYYPYSVSHYPEYNKASFQVCGVEASGLETIGVFDILDPSMNQKASIRGDQELFLGGFPGKKESLILFGEKSITALDQNYSTLWQKKLEGATITGANVIAGEYAICAELNSEALNRERRHETTIRIYGANGSEKASFIVDSKVTGISSKGRTAAIKAGSEVYFTDANGQIMDMFTARADVQDVQMAGEDLAYVAASGTITRVRIKTDFKFLGIF